MEKKAHGALSQKTWCTEPLSRKTLNPSARGWLKHRSVGYIDLTPRKSTKQTSLATDNIDENLAARFTVSWIVMRIAGSADLRTNRKTQKCVDHIPGIDVGLRQGACHGKIPDGLVVTVGRAASQPVSTMLDLVTSASAPTRIGLLSLSVAVQQLAGHCTATTTNGQPLRSLLDEYGQASCCAICMHSC